MIDLEQFIETRSLALSHAKFMEEKEQLPPGAEISVAKKKEIERLEKKLRKRLYKNLCSDVLPIKRIASINPKLAKKLLISFHFEVFSSMNTRIDRFKIEAFTKEEAWLEAWKKARAYPGKVNLKIS